MRLQAGLGVSTPEASEMAAAFTKVLALARHLGDDDYQLRALRGLFLYHAASGRFRTAHPFALEFHALARRGSDRTNLMFGERMMGVAEHYVGDQMSARRHLEQVLALDDVSDQGRDVNGFLDVVRFGTDSRVSTRVFLARVLWLQGYADQAGRMVKQSLAEAEATGHAFSQCYVLAMAACPIAFWMGDQAAAARYCALLVDLSRRHALPHWSGFGDRFERVLAIRAGGRDGGSPRRSNGQEERVDPNFSFRTLTALSQLAEALGHVGRIDEGLVLIGAGIEQFEANCFTPELVRLKGELSPRMGVPDAAGFAEIHFRRALHEAREYGALSWELRAAASLARLLRDQGCPEDGMAVLRPVYERFTEGFDTVDLIAAERLLRELGAPPSSWPPGGGRGRA